MSGTPLFLSSLGLVNSLGSEKATVAAALFRGDTGGMRTEEGWIPGRPARLGRVIEELPGLPSRWAADDCRNNRLLLQALAGIRDDLEEELRRHGPRRIGVVLGTSTSGMLEGEEAVALWQAEGRFPTGFHYQQQEIGRSAHFLAECLGLEGPALTVSTACTSSGRALISARNLIQAGLCEAAVVGGSDTLSRLTVTGFSALAAACPEPCNPMSRNRKGINLGEGAALFLLRKTPSEIAFAGAGESSDAYHVSAPDPSGAGVESALRMALRESRSAPDAGGIYLNLHATATRLNDAMEASAVARVFPDGIPCSGTKPLTGHTLGASAATELAFCWLTLNSTWNPEQRLPPHIWDGEVDPELPPLDLVQPRRRLPGLMVCLSNSMAFGGNNLCLALMRGC